MSNVKGRAKIFSSKFKIKKPEEKKVFLIVRVSEEVKKEYERVSKIVSPLELIERISVGIKTPVVVNNPEEENVQLNDILV